MKKLFLVIAVMLAVGCGNNGKEVSETATTADSVALRPHANVNSIYFWKTTFALDDAEREFLAEHQIKRLYLHYFDVVMDNGWLDDQLAVVPIATINFKQTPPDGLEVVPTVYITLDALRAMKDKEPEYADKIATRVLAMTKRHKIEGVNEVQLDCDWTKNTAASYFKVCEGVRDTLHSRGIALSVTMRLHQLGSEEFPPAADREVLMLYNTGALQNATTENSILSASEVAKYLRPRHIENMDFAFPTFAWSVWFRDKKFQAIIRRTDFSDRALYQPQRGGTFKVVKDHYLEGHDLRVGDMIRLENSDYDEIIKVKEMLDKRLADLGHSNILYHLDSTNLSKYTHDEIENIYSTR